MKRIAIIYNPKAGTGKIKKLLKIKERLDLNHSVTIFDTTKPGDATDIARRECNHFDIIVAAGGDGTINEVVNGLKVGSTLGIIPLGTANIMAIEAGIKTDIHSICTVLENGNIKKIYIPHINQKKFCLMAGIGYDGDIVHHMNPSLKKTFGKAMFGFLGFVEFLKSKKYKIKIEADNETYFGNWVLATKAKHYAGPYKISQTTSIFENNLICYVFKNLTRLNFLYYLFLILFYGDLSKSKDIITLSSNYIKITSDEVVNAQCDGEKLSHLPINISFKSEYIQLLSF